MTAHLLRGELAGVVVAACGEEFRSAERAGYVSGFAGRVTCRGCMDAPVTVVRVSGPPAATEGPAVTTRRPVRPEPRLEKRQVRFRVWRGRWGLWRWQLLSVGMGLISEGGSSVLPSRSRAKAERRARRKASRVARSRWPDAEHEGTVTFE